MLILIEIALATFAVAYLIRYTDGPFDVLWEFRRKIGMEWGYDEKQEIVEYAEDGAGFLASLVSCWWCLSTWISAFWTALAVLLLGLSLTEAPFFWFGAITLSGIIKKVLDG